MTEAKANDVVETMQVNTMIVVAVSLMGMLLIGLLPLFYTMLTGDFPGASRFYGLEEDSEFVNVVFTIRDFFV